MKILYVSRFCSDAKSEKLFSESRRKPALQAQKFHSLLVKGFVQNRASLHALSSLPVTNSTHKRLWWKGEKEVDKSGINYDYMPLINIPLVKHIFFFISTFIKTIRWCGVCKEDEKVLVCDILDLTISISSYMAAKLCKCKTIALVTDVPSYMEYGQSDIKGLGKIISIIYKSITTYFMKRYDGYILLTEHMNSVVNPKNRPYIVVEGLVDINMRQYDCHIDEKYKEKVVIYAGALYERYGVKKLISAFSKLKVENARLWVYGSGEMEKEILEYTSKDPRIKFFGMVTNNQVVKEEMKAALLVNPRPSDEEFTKYSFPSKNMEYMVSGTPMLTTRLPGMPKEYYEHIYLIEDETTEGFSKTLKEILSKPSNELHQKGNEAKNFVLKEKNNVIQAKKVLELIDLINRKNTDAKNTDN